MIRRAIIAGLALPALLLAGLALYLHSPIAVPGFDATRAAWQPSEAYLLDRHGEVIHQRRIDFGVRRFAWRAQARISPALLRAVITAEDRRFLRHSGVDWLAVAGAGRDLVSRGRVRGASTITMQLAALLEPRLRAGNRRRGILTKFRQMRFALALERHWSKQQILEAYLNLLSYRGELQGINAAAGLLLGKNPDGLDGPESLVLAALLPAPASRPERLLARACAIARAQAAHADCQALKAVVRAVTAGGGGRVRIADAAPHLASRLLERPGERLSTTLDGDLQRFAAQVLGDHLARVAGRNVRDGAALVVDNASGDILAYVASAGAASRARHVDGIRARRQAGSTLKPFLYGLALEERLLTAASIIDDSPVNLTTPSGQYIPQNYDRRFRGLVSLRTALGNSLNVPAVRTAALVGVDRFRSRLFDLGYRGIDRPGDYYGFALALGSAEVSLIEQATAYRALARGGRTAPLRLRASDPATPGRQVMSADSAFLIADILADRSARMLTFGLDNRLNLRFWAAVKTGTSKNMRDNWCIGFTARYTVAVWVGNFEGEPMRGVTGMTGAAPAWAEIVNYLQARDPATAPAAPEGLERRRVRFLPPFESARAEWFLAGTSQAVFRAARRGERAPRITRPTDGEIIALDPDIPRTFQRLRFESRGDGRPALYRLDGGPVGTAAAAGWLPLPGRHALELVDPAGRVLDRVNFRVRPLR